MKKIPGGEILIGNDYLNMSVKELSHHDDFSPRALVIVIRVLDMTSKQLESLNIDERGEINGR